MRRLLVMFLGMSMAIGLLVVPSFASTTPFYPSGSSYEYFTGTTPSTSWSNSRTNFYNAVAYSLSYGFNVMSKGFAALNTAHDKMVAALPSGNYRYFFGTSPSVGASTGTEAFYKAVTDSLSYGFSMVSNGLYTSNQNQSTMNTTLTAMNKTHGTISTNVKNLKAALVKATSFSYIADGSDAKAYSDTSAVLDAINLNLFNGLRHLFTKVDLTNSRISTLNSNLKSTLNTNSTALLDYLKSQMEYGSRSFANNLALTYTEVGRMRRALMGNSTSLTYGFDLSGSSDLSSFDGAEIEGGFPMIHRWASIFFNMLFDPVDDELKDETSDQKKELLDKFYGDGSNGVQSGQIGSMGDISSSAGGLLDSGGKVENVFSEIGNSGSSVWSWFSQENSNAINGAGGAARVAAEDSDVSPTPEIVVDFYGAQRDEFLSMLGGG